MPVARYNEDALKENGGKKSKKGVSGNSSSSSNGTVKQKRKVDSAGIGGPSTVKIATANTSGVGSEKSSKQFRDTKVKSSSGKSCRGSGKNSVGTLEQAIRERNIFTTFTKMPAEIQTTLIKNGWIGKITANNCSFGRSDAAVEVISLHKNEERVRGVAKRYESGLVWMDAHSGGVDWMTLRPDVVVNRFPRDANASLKLCGHALAGRSEFDGHYPRAYTARAEGIHADSFVADYSLTACVSLLRAFVDGGHQNMCAKNGQVPLSALNFAAFKCHQYLTDDRSLFPASFPGKGAAWETFFQHYYKIVHDRRKFAAPVDDEEAVLRYLTASSVQLVDRLTAARPQTAIDGYQNVWIVKCTAALRGGRPAMSNKIDGLLDSIGRCGGAHCVVQKYIETPLLRDNIKSDVHTWIVLSTLDGRLTVWLHRTCAVQPYAQRFSLHHEAAASGHFDRVKSHGLHAALRPTALTCGLNRLARAMQRDEKTGKQQKRRHRQRQRADEGGENDDGDDEIYSAIRRSVVSAMTAAAAAGSLDLRPNCLELFRGTFVLGGDTRPWLIDIVSDDPCLDADCRHGDRAAPTAVVARSVARGVAKMLVDRGRGRATRIGMFDMVHECPMPADAVSYAPRPYVVSARTSTASKMLVNCRIERSRGHASQGVPSVTRSQRHWWDDSSISTYVQTITADDVAQDQPRTSSPVIGPPAEVDDAELSSEANAASNENIDLCGPLESRLRLPLSERCKTKFSSVQKICKFIMSRGRKKHNGNP